MLPCGFKKDARVYLHKNPKIGSDEDKPVMKRYLDTTEEQSFNENSPYYAEYQGKQFKKDSRSWLHKSSFKKQRTKLRGPDPVAGDGCSEPVSSLIKLFY